VANQLKHITNTAQNHHMQEITRVEDNITEQEAVKEYVDGLENNIEYYKEWCAIYQTQRDIARNKVKQLEMQVLHLNQIISSIHI
jgi:uncharacterized protein YecA (UPF0149 family)